MTSQKQCLPDTTEWHTAQRVCAQGLQELRPDRAPAGRGEEFFAFDSSRESVFSNGVNAGKLGTPQGRPYPQE